MSPQKTYYEWTTASTAEKDDSIEFEGSWIKMKDDADDFDVKYFTFEWKYGNKPSGFLRFLLWTVLLLGVVGGAAYFLM